MTMSIDDLKKHIKGLLIQHDDNEISVIGDVDFTYCSLTKIPFKFRAVTGNFDCSHNKLTDLVNAPDLVGGDFFCTDNNILKLVCPKEVHGSIDCSFNYELDVAHIDKPEILGGKIRYFIF